MGMDRSLVEARCAGIGAEDAHVIQTGRLKPSLPLVLLLAVGGGCSHLAVGPVPPGVAEAPYAALQALAGRDLHCPLEDSTYQGLGENRHLFRGCGAEMILLLFEGAEAAGFGFPRGFIEPAPANHFAKTIGCPLREVRESKIDVQNRVVEGCGHRVSYGNMCDPQGECRTGPAHWSGCIRCAWTPLPAVDGP